MVETNQPGAPNVTLEESVRLYLGGKRVEVHHFGRAHTDGDVVAYFPDHRVVAMGDMFTVGDGLPPLVDYPGVMHHGFADNVWLVPQLGFDPVAGDVGTVDAVTAVQQQNAWLKRFFDRQIKG